MKVEINDVVSPELQVTVLEEGQTATYKLCDVDLKDLSHIDEASGKPKNCAPRRSMLPKATITDPFTKRRVIIQNITGTEIKMGPDDLPREVPKIERLNFPRTGALTVTYEHPGTYSFLERHPRNRDNPFRDKSKLPLFYRVNAKRKAITEMENIYLKSDALEWVKKADLTELKAIYQKLDPTSQGMIGTSEFEVMRRDMFSFADRFPPLLLKASNNKEAKMKIQIMDAEFFNIIAFFDIDEMGVNRNRVWMFTGGMGTICEIEINENKYDALAAYFVKKDNAEGKAAYRTMIETLKKILGVPAGVTEKPKAIIVETGSDKLGNAMKVKVDVPA